MLDLDTFRRHVDDHVAVVVEIGPQDVVERRFKVLLHLQ